jgi:hypothetical protein
MHLQFLNRLEPATLCKTIGNYRSNYPLIIKTCEIVQGILFLANNKNDKLKNGLSHAISLLYFYQNLQGFRSYFYPIDSRSISEVALYVFLEEVLSKSEVRNISNFSTNILREIKEKDLIFRDVDQLLQFVLKKVAEKDNNVARKLISSASDHYRKSQPIKHIPLAEKIANLFWKIVGFGGMAATCMHWADKKIYTKRLDKIIGISLYTAFALQLFENIRKCQDEALTIQERSLLQWESVACFAKISVLSLRYLNEVNFIHCGSVIAICDVAANVFYAFVMVKDSQKEFFPELIHPSPLHFR